MKTLNKINPACRFLLCGILLLAIHSSLIAQERILIHSHNDYHQRVPFYQAYAQQVYSIEADVYADNPEGLLLVGHDREELTNDKTLDALYIEPIVKIFRQNGGRPWKDSDKTFQLLIDIKTSTEPALGKIVEKVGKYPEVFDISVNPYAVKVVISGNRPHPADFPEYPSFIWFDGLIDKEYTPEQLERIPLISPSFSQYARWNGKGALKPHEVVKVQAVIDKAHAWGKPVRFWGIPNAKTAWNTLHNMGVDIINTDYVEACTDFFHNFADKNFRIKQEAEAGVTKTDRLDKTTSGFQGFDREKIQLTQPVAVYEPTYLNDGAPATIKNVIYLIGDGMGLAQINAAETVNKGLTMFRMKHIGLQKSNAKDVYTTDSAAGGSALATGESHYNRHISMSENGEVYPSLTDYAYDKGLACGVVTWGNLADATPAAFYGHSQERDDSDEITNYLLDGKLTLLNGSGMDVFTRRRDGRDILAELSKTYRITTEIEDINAKEDKVICVDSRMDLAATQETIDLLAKATAEAIEKLSKASDKGFFLMVEGAKIDYAGHANSLPGSIVETLSFDLVVREALRFADTNGETLVVVTADHETGGLTLIDGDSENGHITAYYVTDDHTPLMLPVFAYGPGAVEFNGIYKNTEIFHKIKKLTGW